MPALPNAICPGARRASLSRSANERYFESVDTAMTDGPSIRYAIGMKSWMPYPALANNDGLTV